MEYTVAIVFSNYMLSRINDILDDYLNKEASEVGMFKIERIKDRKTGEMRDSDRTLILMKKTLFARALEAGLDQPQPKLDFRIAEYVLADRNFPMEGYSSNFYIIIPSNVHAVEAEMFIQDRMKCFANFGLLGENDYNIKVPLVSRITGEHRSFMTLRFTDNVTLQTRAVIKLMLHDSHMYSKTSDSIHNIPVFWSKKYKIPVSSVPLNIKILKKE